MILRELSLNNIRSYESEKVSFPEGTVLLAGDIGAGKSSILLAVEFALFGSKRGRLSSSSLLRTGENRGSVSLTMDIDGKSVTVFRTLKREKDSVRQGPGYVVVDGVKTEGTPVELNSALLSLLGYGEDSPVKNADVVFRYTVYTPQEHMKQIILEDPELRIETLRKVFQIDKYARISDAASILASQLGATARELRAKSQDLEAKEQELKEVESRASELGKNLSELNSRFKEVTERLARQEERVEKLSARFSEMGRARELLEHAKKSLSLIISRIESSKQKLVELEKEQRAVEAELSSMPPPGEALKSMDELRAEESELRKKIEEEEQKARILEERIRNSGLLIEELGREAGLKKEILSQKEEAERSIESLKKKLSALKELEERESELGEKMGSLREEMAKLNKVVEQSQHLISDIKSLSKCPVCKQNVTEEHKKAVVEEQLSKISAAKRKLDALKKEEGRLREEIERIRSQKAEALSLEEQLSAKQAQLAVLREKLSEIGAKEKRLEEEKKRHEALASELKELSSPERIRHREEQRKRLEKLGREMQEALAREEAEKRRRALESQRGSLIKKRETLLGEISKTESERDSTQREIESLQKKLAEGRDVESELKKERQALERARDEHTALVAERSRVESLISSTRERSISLKKEITERKEWRKKAKLAETRAKWLKEFFIPLIGTMERHVMGGIYQEFNEVFVQWFNLLVEEETLSVRLDQDFSPVAEQNGYEIPVTDLSGGEKTALSLAYRLALNKAINDFVSSIKTKDLVILDEPTDGFSDAQLDRVRDVLEQLEARQAILVSHESKIESFVQHVLRVEKSEHVSRVLVQ